MKRIRNLTNLLYFDKFYFLFKMYLSFYIVSAVYKSPSMEIFYWSFFCREMFKTVSAVYESPLLVIFSLSLFVVKHTHVSNLVWVCSLKMVSVINSDPVEKYSKVSIKRPVLLYVLVWNFLKSRYWTTSTISEKFDCTVLFMYLPTVSIIHPGLDFFEKVSIKRPVLFFKF